MARRISLLTVGTLGDVGPMVALGLALKEQGYEVSLAAPEDFLPFVESHGLEARRCGGDFGRFLKEGEMAELAGVHTVVMLTRWLWPGQDMRAMFEGIYRDAVAASADADAIIFHPAISVAAEIAEARRIPAIMAGLGSVSPSAEALLSCIPGTQIAAWNRYGYSLLSLQRLAYVSVINDLRRSLGLKRTYRLKHPHKVDGRRVPVIYPVSPTLQLRPNTEGDEIHFTGYWSRETASGWRPSPRLTEFLKAGPRPIYIGFGSMPALGLERSEMILRACEAAGQRAVIGNGRGEFHRLSLSENFHLLDEYAPHDQLLPEMAAVIHHGGVGTTHAALRAGRPSFVCSFMLDQKYWGHTIFQVGAGPDYLEIQHWTEDTLTKRIRDLVTNQGYAARAAEIGSAMQRENGIARALEVVRSVIEGELASKAPLEVAAMPLEAAAS